jgi:hypothetical protein
MPARKMRVELFDTDGNRYSISFEGQVTRDKAVRLLDLVELLGGIPNTENSSGVSNAALPGSQLSKYEKVRLVVQKHLPIVWFSSREVQSIYEQELKEPIGLSTVATYLSRMATKGLVLKAGSSNNLKYKASTKTPNIPQPTIEQKVQ